MSKEKSQPTKKPSAKWANEKEIVITADLLKGFGRYEFYYEVPITEEEFMNRLSKCQYSEYNTLWPDKKQHPKKKLKTR